MSDYIRALPRFVDTIKLPFVSVAEVGPSTTNQCMKLLINEINFGLGGNWL